MCKNIYNISGEEEGWREYMANNETLTKIKRTNKNYSLIEDYKNQQSFYNKFGLNLEHVLIILYLLLNLQHLQNYNWVKTPSVQTIFFIPL